MNMSNLKCFFIPIICLVSSITSAASWPDQMRVTFRCVQQINELSFPPCDFNMNFEINGTYLLSKISENTWIYQDSDPNKHLVITCTPCQNPCLYLDYLSQCCGTWKGLIIEATINEGTCSVFASTTEPNYIVYFSGGGNSLDIFGVWSKSIENIIDSPYMESGFRSGTYGGEVLISWENQVSSVCGDINGDGFVNEDDFLTVVRDIYNSNPRSMGLFAEDGTHVDVWDVFSYDWWLNLATEKNRFCELPMVSCCPDEGYLTSHSPPSGYSFEGEGGVILAKCGGTAPGSKMQNALFPLRTFPRSTSWELVGQEDFSPYQGNMKLVKSYYSSLYVINSRSGISRLDIPSEITVPPGRFDWANEPIYGVPATIYVGIQERWVPVPGTDYEIPNIYGRPVLAADFHVEHGDHKTGWGFHEFAYIAPVVVKAVGHLNFPPYEAAAKIKIESGSNPPYSIVELYVSPYAEDGDKIRGIAKDGANSVITLNSTTITRFGKEGVVQSFYLYTLEGYPVALAGRWPYSGVSVVCSGGYDKEYSYLYLVDDEAFNYGGPTMPPVIINGISYVSDVSCGGGMISGFNFLSNPPTENPFSSSPPFYSPAAVIRTRRGYEHVFIDFDDNIALPLSIANVDNNQESIGFYYKLGMGIFDCDEDGIINFIDYAYWSRYSSEAAFLTCMYWLGREIDWESELIVGFCQRWLEED